MAIFDDLIGTLRASFKIGLTGVLLKNSSGNLLVRNTSDSADAAATVSQLNVSGESIIINSDAANTGNDRTLTIQRNSVQSAGLTFVFPGVKGTDGYAFVQKAGTASNVVEFDYAAAGTTAQCRSVDTTTLAFGSTSPVTMFTLPANAVVNEVRVTIDTSFNGTPSMSVGVSGTTSKYMASTQVDLTAAANTVFRSVPGLAANGSTEALIITYSAGSASAGSARVEVDYSIPT